MVVIFSEIVNKDSYFFYYIESRLLLCFHIFNWKSPQPWKQIKWTFLISYYSFFVLFLVFWNFKNMKEKQLLLYIWSGLTLKCVHRFHRDNDINTLINSESFLWRITCFPAAWPPIFMLNYSKRSSAQKWEWFLCHPELNKTLNGHFSLNIIKVCVALMAGMLVK